MLFILRMVRNLLYEVRDFEHFELQNGVFVSHIVEKWLYSSRIVQFQTLYVTYLCFQVLLLLILFLLEATLKLHLSTGWAIKPQGEKTTPSN